MAKSGPTSKVNVDSQGIILKGYDVVAYFKQGKPVKGNPAFESTYQGATYLFASSADKADFDKDPAKYAPQYGAFCSYGVTIGVLADLEGPDAFAVYKGKLYLCGNQGALKDLRLISTATSKKQIRTGGVSQSVIRNGSRKLQLLLVPDEVGAFAHGLRSSTRRSPARAAARDA